MQNETALSGGRNHSNVGRVGDTVHRPQGARSDYAHALLLHLEKQGFAHAPRYLGLAADGREILSYVAGSVPHAEVTWTEEQIAALMRLVRQFHDATEGSTLAANQEVVCHNDIAPWNVVLLGNELVSLIDFDDAGPGRRVDDLGYALWTFLRLGSDVPVDEQALRIRRALAAYGHVDATDLLEAIDAQQRRILTMRTTLAVSAADASARDFSARAAARVRSDIVWTRTNRRTLLEVLEQHAE